MNDPYMDIVDEHWARITEVFRAFESKNPIMLFDVQEQRVYAYPYREFKTELGEKDQRQLTRMHKKVVAGKSIVVFVRDNKERKLVSYAFGREAA